MTSKESKVVSMRMSKEEQEELESLAKSEGYKNKAELMRMLIRKEWDRWAEKVKKHYKEHPEEYVDIETLEQDLKEKK